MKNIDRKCVDAFRRCDSLGTAAEVSSPSNASVPVYYDRPPCHADSWLQGPEDCVQTSSRHQGPHHLSLSLSASPSVSAIHQQYRQYNNGDVRMAIDTLSVLSMRREWDGYWPVSAVVTGAVVHNSNVLRVLSKIMHEIARWWAAIWYNTRHRRRRRRTDSQRDRKIEPVVT